MDPELVGLLGELVRIPSMNPGRDAALGSGYGEGRLAARVAAFLREAGLAVELQEIAPGRPNVLARLDSADSARRTPRSALLFVAHLDTVPVEGMAIPPFEGGVRDGRLWGRGACDNKGSLAAMLVALRRVAAARANPRAILFAGTADEESGYRGIRAALGKCGVMSAECGARCEARPFAAFVGEPTGLNIVIAHRGVVRWTMEQRGKSAHSAFPWLGVNAIYRMAPVLGALEALAAQLARRPAHPLVGPPSLSVGTIRGGHSVNTVPDCCTIEVDRRLLPGESPEAAEAEVRALAERHGAAIERFFCTGAFEAPPDCPAARMACEAVRAVSSRLDRALTIGNRKSEIGNFIGVAYATEAPEAVAAGIPAVVIGPGDAAKAHSADECIELDQLQAAEQVYEHLMTQDAPC